jgi:hypothetical protein
MKSNISLGESAESSSLHFALEPEGLRDQESLNAWKPYMSSYMARNGLYFMVYKILCQAHLKEVSITQNQETMTR